MNPRKESEQFFSVQFEEYLKPNKLHKSHKLINCSVKKHGVQKYSKSQPNISNKRKKLSIHLYSHIDRFKKLFLNLTSFLRAGDDKEICKRKSGFEIYCEMASMHGFQNVIHANNLERSIWCLAICFSIIITSITLVIFHISYAKQGTTLNAETTTLPAWTIPFPAITICNLNRVSLQRLKTVSEQFKVNMSALQQLAWIHTVPYNLSQSQFELLQAELKSVEHQWFTILEKIAPSCEEQVLSCMWNGRIKPCKRLFRSIITMNGVCCTFNYYPLDLELPRSVYGCAPKSGLSVLLNQNPDDYAQAATLSPGYEIIIHNSYDVPDNGAQRAIIHNGYVFTIDVRPQNTQVKDYVITMPLHRRRCYFPGERQLRSFPNYTQANCLAECRRLELLKKCECCPPFFDGTDKVNGKCGLSHIMCLLKYKNENTRLLIADSHTYRAAKNTEKFICDCYPLCSSHHYEFVIDASVLNRRYSTSDNRFYKNITIKDHLQVYVTYAELNGALFSVDLTESWLAYLGTFGGITGLFMGCSFVSLYELIFFVIVRPVFNYITKRRLQYAHKKKRRIAILPIRQKPE